MSDPHPHPPTPPQEMLRWTLRGGGPPLCTGLSRQWGWSGGAGGGGGADERTDAQLLDQSLGAGAAVRERRLFMWAVSAPVGRPPAGPER